MVLRVLGLRLVALPILVLLIGHWRRGGLLQGHGGEEGIAAVQIECVVVLRPR